MRSHPGQRGIVLSLVALLVLAMAGLGFAHGPARMATKRSFDIAAYALPDGTVPVLCLTAGKDASAAGSESVPGAAMCDACLIPPAVLVAGPCFHTVARQNTPSARPLRPSSDERPPERHYANAARSPPFHLSSSA